MMDNSILTLFFIFLSFLLIMLNYRKLFSQVHTRATAIYGGVHNSTNTKCTQGKNWDAEFLRASALRNRRAMVVIVPSIAFLGGAGKLKLQDGIHLVRTKRRLVIFRAIFHKPAYDGGT